MPNRDFSIRRLLRSFFLLFFLAAAIQLQAQDRVEWVAVEGADHYRIEIHRNGELVLDTRSNETWIPLFLPAGNYEFRVEAINAFGKVASSSEWSPLSILAPSIPFIISLLPGEIHEGATTEFTAQVSGFIAAEDGKEGSSFHLEAEDENPILLDIVDSHKNIDENGEPAGWSDVSLSAGRKRPDVDLWTLVMMNPDGRESRMDGALQVLDNLNPRIRSVNPNEIPAGSTHNPLILKIAGLEEGASISFQGPSPLQPTLLSRPETDTLEYSLNLEKAEPGWYSVSVTNPSGSETVREKALKILPRPLTEEEIAAENALGVDTNEAMVLPEHPRSIFFGWAISFPVGDTADYYNPDFVGLSIGYSQVFNNDFFRKLHWLNGLGWDFTASFTNHSTNYPLFEIRLNRYSFLMGLNYVTPFNSPVNLMLRVSSGIGVSFYTSPDIQDRDGDLGGFTLRDLGSLDYVMRFGGGMRIDISPRWYIDVVCDVSASFYLSRSAWSVLPKIEGGWRL